MSEPSAVLVSPRRLPAVALPHQTRAALRVLLLLGVPNVLFSAAMVQHAVGQPLAIAYLLLAPLAITASVVALARSPLRRLIARPGPWGLALLAAIFLVAAVVFAVVYPIADARRSGGAGTDADDALDLAVRSLLAGEYPYAARTYLNNPISPLPGWVLLAAPFVLAFGRAAALNVVWLAVWLVVLAVEARSTWLASLLAGLTLALLPGVTLTYLNGSDQVSSVIAVCALLLLIRRLPPRPTGWLAPLGLGVASGLVLSSRFNVALVLPLLVGALARRQGLARAAVYGLAAAAAFAAVTLPFWAASPAAFSPLHTYGILGRFDALLPGFGLAVPLATAALAGALGLRLARGGDPWRAMAVVLSLPVVAGFLASLPGSARLDLWPLVYGIMSTPLWVLAAVPAVAELFGLPTHPERCPPRSPTTDH